VLVIPTPERPEFEVEGQDAEQHRGWGVEQLPVEGQRIGLLFVGDRSQKDGACFQHRHPEPRPPAAAMKIHRLSVLCVRPLTVLREGV
jgi:hypothetical protein